MADAAAAAGICCWRCSDGDAVSIFVRRETAGDSYLLLAEFGIHREVCDKNGLPKNVTHISRIDYHSRQLIRKKKKVSLMPRRQMRHCRLAYGSSTSSN
jgi:hypothetical protein